MKKLSPKDAELVKVLSRADVRILAARLECYCSDVNRIVRQGRTSRLSNEAIGIIITYARNKRDSMSGYNGSGGSIDK